MARSRRWRRVYRLPLYALLVLVLMTALAVGVLRWVNPISSAFMLEARWQAHVHADSHYRTHYQWVDLEAISPHAAIAVIASEDQRFPFHYGFDFQSIRAAVRAHEHGHRLRGASTLTQQVAKNLFLWPGHSFIRKGLEAALTVMIEALWPKERILEVYLNIAEFGPGVYGVQAAATQFFHHSAARLTRVESATLAAVLPNPRQLHVGKPSRFVLAQRDHILKQMADLGGPAYLDALQRSAAAQPHNRYNAP